MVAFGRPDRNYFLSYALEQRTALFSCFDSSGYLFYVEGF
ncbi:hypothetical protein CU017_0940 [Enterococcus lactis]|nr:hypothetical protein [Enterococcus lactis]